MKTGEWVAFPDADGRTVLSRVLADAAGTANLKVGDPVSLDPVEPGGRRPYPEPRLGTKTHFMPAAWAACMPGWPSSKTRQRSGVDPHELRRKKEHVRSRLSVLDVVGRDDDREERCEARLLERARHDGPVSPPMPPRPGLSCWRALANSTTAPISSSFWSELMKIFSLSR